MQLIGAKSRRYPTQTSLRERNKKLRYGAFAACAVLLAACQGSGLKVASIPTFDHPNNAAAHELTVKTLRVSNSEVCPLNEDDQLLVFTGPVSSNSDGTEITVGSVKITAGTTIESGTLVQITGGYTCGGTHYPTAWQVPESPNALGG